MLNKKSLNLKGGFNYKTETVLFIFSIGVLVFSILTKIIEKKDKPELKKIYTIIGGVLVGLSLICDIIITAKDGNFYFILINVICIIVYAVLVGLSYNEKL